MERTEKICEAVENKTRDIIPTNERELIVDNIALQARLYNLAFAADRAHNGVRREIGKRPMARDTSAAALALHRSGLGPRAGAIDSLASDPQSALMAELDRPGAGLVAARNAKDKLETSAPRGYAKIRGKLQYGKRDGDPARGAPATTEQPDQLPYRGGSSSTTRRRGSALQFGQRSA